MRALGIFAFGFNLIAAVYNATSGSIWPAVVSAFCAGICATLLALGD